jgi:hypothetical protein
MYVNNETHILRYNEVVLKTTLGIRLQYITVCYIISALLLTIVIVIDKGVKRQFKYNRE